MHPARTCVLAALCKLWQCSTGYLRLVETIRRLGTVLVDPNSTLALAEVSVALWMRSPKHIRTETISRLGSVLADLNSTVTLAEVIASL
jgi:hypothetical protein